MILLNSAGGSSSDPILSGLGFDVVLNTGALYHEFSTGSPSNPPSAWIDTGTGFPGSNSVTLNPSSLPSGSDGYAVTSTYLVSGTKLDYTASSVGDWVYLDHPDYTAQACKIISDDGTYSTTSPNPFSGAGSDVSNVTIQQLFNYNVDTVNDVTSGTISGTQNYFKVRYAIDFDSTNTDSIDSFYVQDAPSGASYVSLDGGSYTGQTVNDTDYTLAILSGWTNNGGVSHVELVSGGDFTWQSGGTGEKTLAAAESDGLSVSGTGAKSGTLRLKSAAGSSTYTSVALSITVQASGPTLGMSLKGG